MKILMTGFSPFDGERINPAWEAVKHLPDAIAGAQVVKLELPTSFARCFPPVEAAVRDLRPDAVICVGQAGGRTCVTVERLGINLIDARIPDNDGAQPIDEPAAAGGPAAYFATLPVKAIVEHVRSQGLPCQLSCTAGTYVCNYLLYRVLHLAAVSRPALRAGFLHVPYSEEQAADKPAGTPSAALATITRALELAVEAVVLHPQDIRAGMGTLD